LILLAEFFHHPAAVNQPLQAPATSEAILNAINAVQAAACR
jgi:xanthine dehydrogenase molybdopterin-binding subunit B